MDDQADHQTQAQLWAKNEIKNSNLCPSLLGQKLFVRFLEELKNKTKCPFEII